MTRVLSPRSHGRDEFRFGDGSEPVLRPGTSGWTVEDLRDPEIRRLWDARRYEIIHGVLAIMPAARFRGGMVVDNLKFVLHTYFRQRNVPGVLSSEVDIEISDDQVVRADAAAVFGEDLARFAAQSFDPPDTGWQDHPLKLPPTLIIESLGPCHETHDQRVKRGWYQDFGVGHYWLVDAYKRELQCLVLDAGSYRVDASGSGDDARIAPPTFPGLTFELRDIWTSDS